MVHNGVKITTAKLPNFNILKQISDDQINQTTEKIEAEYKANTTKSSGKPISWITDNWNKPEVFYRRWEDVDVNESEEEGHADAEKDQLFEDSTEEALMKVD